MRPATEGRAFPVEGVVYLTASHTPHVCCQGLAMCKTKIKKIKEKRRFSVVMQFPKTRLLKRTLCILGTEPEFCLLESGGQD